MGISTRLDQFHARAKQNRWLRYFAIFNRLALAAGFIPAGIVKLMGERFANGLSELHPMGAYLTELYHTGYYYTWIGIMQILAAILLLIPRTVVLGALIYFPIILNICILSFAVRFDGSLFTSPLMVLATLYLLCWHYDKLKYILPFKQPRTIEANNSKTIKRSNKFPTAFFAGVFITVVAIVFGTNTMYSVMPRNTVKTLSCLNLRLRIEPKQVASFVTASIHRANRSMRVWIAMKIPRMITK